jgi:N-acetylglucosaminyldiphosphoundecaprenol N-acetyl-beta-D-mannosaminyltransferase
LDTEEQKLIPVQRRFRVLGVEVDAVQIPQVIARIEQWIAERGGCHYVTLTNVHAVMEANRDSRFKAVLSEASIVCPDGMPLVWLGRLSGHRGVRRRVYGPDLMLELLNTTATRGYRHFFYGGSPGVPEQMIANFRRSFPIEIAGTYSPPFRRLSDAEDATIVRLINNAAPDVLWVGLGCPKQEYWMHAHRNQLNVPVVLGVGQAFDVFAGNLAQAPTWMREHGWEWLFRLLSEPQRLWKRYLIYNTEFLYLLAWELFRPRKPDSK